MSRLSVVSDRSLQPSEPGISIRALSFTAEGRGGRRTEILHDVDVTVQQGEFVSLVGPSGSGKSTLLNFIAGLTPVQSGDVRVLGEVPGKTGRIGYMFQQHGLLPWRSIRANVELGLEIAGLPAAERRERAEDILAEMGLRGFEAHFPAELSGGMRQRAALARTLVAQPDVILMDEPFGALDAQTKILMQELFSRYWHAHRRTTLFVTHDLNEAIALSDRVLVMSARPGGIIAEHAVELPHPRNFDHLRRDERLNALYERIWIDVKREASASMQGTAQ